MTSAAGSRVNAPAESDPRVRKLSSADINRLLDAGKTPRMKANEQLQAVFEGQQYAGMRDFWDDSVPLRERAPCIRYKLCAVGIESNLSFALGEGRFPTVLSLSSENDKTFDDELGLGKNDSEFFDSFNAKLIDLGRLEHAFRSGYRMAQAARSVAFVLGFRNGLPFADVVWSKLCTPTFDPADPTRCTKLEIRYRFTRPWRDQFITSGEWWTRVFEYLRVIDEKSDTVYRPVPIWDETDAGAVERQTPTDSVTLHGFGFCPVHWYARNRESVVGDQIDGKALHDAASCELLREIDYALSQRHRAAMYAGDPQTVLIGVSTDDPVSGTGRKAMSQVAPEDMGPDGKPRGQWTGALYGGRGQPGTPALRRGALEVWRITDPGGKAFLLTLPGDALKALDDDARDLVTKACDDLGIVIADMSAFQGAGDLSGRTLSFLFSKQINRVSLDREDLGRCCILPVLNLFYRMILGRPSGVYLPGLKKVLPILKRFQRSVDGQGTRSIWFAPQLKLKWGDFFEPSDIDEQTRVGNSVAAKDAGIITLKTAVEHVRGVFQIGSVDQYVETLKQEAEDRQQRAMALASAGKPPPSDSKAPPAGDDGKLPQRQPAPKAKPQTPPGASAKPDA